LKAGKPERPDTTPSRIRAAGCYPDHSHEWTAPVLGHFPESELIFPVAGHRVNPLFSRRSRARQDHSSLGRVGPRGGRRTGADPIPVGPRFSGNNRALPRVQTAVATCGERQYRAGTMSGGGVNQPRRLGEIRRSRRGDRQRNRSPLQDRLYESATVQRAQRHLKTVAERGFIAVSGSSGCALCRSDGCWHRARSNGSPAHRRAAGQALRAWWADGGTV